MVLLGLAPVLLTPLLYNFHLMYESQDIACCQLPLQLPVECGIYSHAQHPSSPSPTLTHHFKGPSPTPLPSPQQRATPRLKQGPFSHVHPPISPLLPPPPSDSTPQSPPSPTTPPQPPILNTQHLPSTTSLPLQYPFPRKHTHRPIHQLPRAPHLPYQLSSISRKCTPSLEKALSFSKVHSVS